mmetsp:Transcript_88727/g.141267  ORF Transcript_88727/g.141267 Transcript_88727/m.141267 type:complete len:494 (+) Transcript_88727:71-1552(+)
MHRNQIPRSNSTFSNIMVSLIGLVIGLAALTLFGRLGPLVGLPILCLLVFIFRRSSGTRSQEGTRGTGATRACAARAARALLCSPAPKIKLPVTIVRLQLSPGSEATATGSTGATVRWSKITLFWKAVMILNSACWGSTFIGTKAGIDALKAADVRNPGAVFGFLRFALAAFPLLPWLGRSSSLESAAMSFLVGLIWGTSYACTFVSYTLGTTGAKAAFITSLQSVVVAACTSIVAGRLQLGTIFSALLAVLGVAFIELNGALDPTLGDAVCMVAPIGVGIGWYVLDKNMKKYPNDFIPSVVIQFAVFTSIFAVWLLKDCDENHQNQGHEVGNHLGSLGSLGSSIIPWFQQLQQLPELLRTPNLLCPLLFASIFGNLLTMLAANVACRYLPVSDVSLIVTTEPLFAAVAAVCCIGETFSLGDCAGGFFIMAALLCNELWGETQDETNEAMKPMMAMKSDLSVSSTSTCSTCSTYALSKCESGQSASIASIETA